MGVPLQSRVYLPRTKGGQWRMWLHHLFSFCGSVARIFFDAIGTTFLGRLVDIAFAASVAVAALLSIHKENGWRAMLAHFQDNYKAGIRFALWCAVIIYAPVIVWSVGKAVYEDHEGLVGRSQLLRSTIKIDADTLRATTDQCTRDKTDLKILGAGLAGTNTALQSQNRDQQNSINNCQTEALKRIIPEPLKVEFYRTGQDKKVDNGIYMDDYIIVTNKNVPQSHVVISCDQPVIESFIGPIPGAGKIGYGGGFPAGSYRVTVNTPEIGPTSPAGAYIKHPAPKQSCGFELR